MTRINRKTGRIEENVRCVECLAVRVAVPFRCALHQFVSRRQTFVVAFGGKAISGPFARALAYDVNLLAALGVRLVLVHGARPQIEEELREKGLESKFHAGYRVTDAAALDASSMRWAASLEIDALLSQGLPRYQESGPTA